MCIRESAEGPLQQIAATRVAIQRDVKNACWHTSSPGRPAAPRKVHFCDTTSRGQSAGDRASSTDSALPGDSGLVLSPGTVLRFKETDADFTQLHPTDSAPSLASFFVM